MVKVRTRFAPSPTGNLHTGGARTALYCWLFAKKNSGDFLLRVEDTDEQRSQEEFINSIITGLSWLGINPDESPVYQSSRKNIYKEYVDKLLSEGKAYKCYCTEEELAIMREEQLAMKKKPKYDRKCLNNKVDKGSMPYVIRFKIPDTGEVSFFDKVRGAIKFNNSELDDFVIVRSDGSPTYNFCVVIDDMLSSITHVIRGDDHINNTPKQIHIYKALNLNIPIFAHLPMIHGEDGKKLSKRHGALDVTEYSKMGILPQALVNFIVRLGWSHYDKEIFSIEELVSFFSLSNVSKSPAVFNQKKLLWINRHYMQSISQDDMYKIVVSYDASLSNIDETLLKSLLDVYSPRTYTILELIDHIKDLFSYNKPSEELAKKYLNDDSVANLHEITKLLKKLEAWDQSSIDGLISKYVKDNELPFSKIGVPIRVVLFGKENSPELGKILSLLGKDEILKRLSDY